MKINERRGVENRRHAHSKNARGSGLGKIASPVFHAARQRAETRLTGAYRLAKVRRSSDLPPLTIRTRGAP